MTAAQAPSTPAPSRNARASAGGILHHSPRVHVQYWTGADIPLEIHSAKLQQAYRRWQNAAVNGVPRLRDLAEPHSPSMVTDVMLLHKLEDDYLIVHQGADYMRNLGRDLRGLLLSELKVPTAPIMKELYDTCLAERQVLYVRYISELSSNNLYWEGLLLPLRAADSRDPAFVKNYLLPIDDKTDILQRIIDRSPLGIVAAIPFGASKGNIQDGRIVIVNAYAKELLKFTEKGAQIHYVRELTPWIRDQLGWEKINEGSDQLQTRVNYICRRTERAYLMTIDPLKRFILLSFYEVRNPASNRLSGGYTELFRPR
jgi:PAS domain-containing protein